MMGKRKQGQAGFTLVELVAVIVVSGIISVVFAKLLSSSVQMFEFITERKDAVHDCRLAMQRISRELRQIASADSIKYAAEDSLEFFKENGEALTIAWGASAVRLNGQPLVAGIASFQFKYFDDKGQELQVPVANMSNIFNIYFEMLVKPGNRPFKISNEVQPRNF